jgi:hypothetical protein
MSAFGSATRFEGEMDPTDIVDYVAEFGELLETGEIISSFTVEIPTDAAALGFRLLPSRPPTLETGLQNILIYVEVDTINQRDLIWCDGGVWMPIEFTINTSLAPRRYQRTFLIRVRQL